VPYFNCPARLRSWNEATTDATTVSSWVPWVPWFASLYDMLEFCVLTTTTL
jgi:hypothetical protein